MVMAHRQFEGEETAAGNVFSGFRHNFGQLAMVAIYSGIYTVAVFGLACLGIGGELLTALDGGAWTRGALIALGVCCVAFTPLIAGAFFAPTLVVLVGEDALWKQCH